MGLGPRCSNAKYLNRKHSTSGLFFRDMYDIIKQKVMRNVHKVMVRKERGTTDGQPCVRYVQIFRDRPETGLKSTALVGVSYARSSINSCIHSGCG